VPYTVEAERTDTEDAALVARVTKHFAEALRAAPDTIGPNADFFYDLGGTSLDYFAMVSAIQGEFDVGFPTDAGHSLSTVNAFCRYIREQG
jgi:acyl carrier protein